MVKLHPVLDILLKYADILKAAAATQNNPKDPLSLPLADFTRDLTINTNSAFVAAQQAVLAFKELPESIAPLLDLGVGKSATAHIIQSASQAYADQGFK
jgi:hypothetical protein